ncbi:MAG TPA: hypothetical protein PKU94_07405 [Candidatus Hydrothermia bacterium]|nr:hypothetical protein [Candidatus Hydrothermae bacterium]MDD3649784.1 hypothetical protein [Candidatus Hydrothermia bacterium]MDD5573446.1 hypothetical protein [Candidatus Hydrothermia bacterium]HOK23685.1 hypothetical protein [Candidatus Hydrothermia bacterium]HOL24394.1 hypothetical protein [Candidatus Hydrothermia bacterium]
MKLIALSFLSCLTFGETFLNPEGVEFSKYYFSPFNSAPVGMSLDLADTSFTLFSSIGGYIGGFGLNAAPIILSTGKPLSFYGGKLIGTSRFVGVSLSSSFSRTSSSYTTDILSKSEGLYLYPALYYSKKSSSAISTVRIGFPYENDALNTPTDTIQTKTRYSLNVSANVYTVLAPQWKVQVTLDFLTQSKKKSFHSIQELLNYDSTYTESNLGVKAFAVYSPFSSTFFVLGPVINSYPNLTEYGLVWAGEYEVFPFFSLLGAFGYYYQHSKVFDAGVEHNSVCEKVLGPAVGLKIKKDFLQFMFLYESNEEKVSSFSFQFRFAR